MRTFLLCLCLTIAPSWASTTQIRSQAESKVISLEPSGQVRLEKESEILLTEKARLVLQKGSLRYRGDSPYEIRLKDVSFKSMDADFEVISDAHSVLLHVYSGEVEVTSPHVNTFVPYMVKEKEGFRFKKARPEFEKKVFESRVPDFKEGSGEKGPRSQK